MSTRKVAKVAPSTPTSDGAGVRLSRSLGTQAVPMVDPFLMLDEFRSDRAGDYLAGFPDHPHRGFETVTYMLAGSMQHKDSRGNTGNLGPGWVQWMTAARGIIHSEMPQQKDGLMWGFQLWVNLPAKDKLGEPRYQDVPPQEIPEVELSGGGRVKVIAGTLLGVTGPIGGVATAPIMLDVSLPAGASLDVPLPAGHGAFLYPFEGAGRFDESDRVVERGNLVVLDREGEAARISATESGPVRTLLVAGRPIDEPVARYGPFVMNTREELEQAFLDYRRGTLA
jgi:redox-sensitive bicupin YhaK (pirin superfamily)